MMMDGDNVLQFCARIIRTFYRPSIVAKRIILYFNYIFEQVRLRPLLALVSYCDRQSLQPSTAKKTPQAYY